MKLNFAKGQGLIPAIIQDASNKNVLMLGYMNQEAFDITLASKTVCFYSRTKQRLWTKGETSGNFLRVHSWETDCDQDTLIFQVSPEGPACHLNRPSCFPTSQENFLLELEKQIQIRAASSDTESYTRALTLSGPQKMAQKIGEEGVELSLAVMSGNKKEIVHEAADLIFHTLVGLNAQNISFEDIMIELKSRNTKKEAPQLS